MTNPSADREAAIAARLEAIGSDRHLHSAQMLDDLAYYCDVVAGLRAKVTKMEAALNNAAGELEGILEAEIRINPAHLSLVILRIREALEDKPL